MAKVAGVSRQTYELWEKGAGEPKASQFMRLMLYCSFDLSALTDQFDKLKK